MAHLPPEFCKQIASARRKQGITQSALAKHVGCKQSAISMFESGRPDKLSMEVVEKIAAVLKVPLEKQPPRELPEIPPASFSKKGYCPNSGCLANIPYIINGTLFIRPELFNLTDEIKYCSICGEVLERCCPQCDTDVTAGACCAVCGTPRVMTTLPPGTEPVQWVAERREEIVLWHKLTGMSAE